MWMAALLVLATDAWASDDVVPPAPPGAVDSRYKVGAGDVVQLQIYGEAALSGKYPINDAGALDLPLVGAIEVLGLTAAEVAARVRERLMAGYVRDPKVTAWVDAFQSQPVQVLGAVGKPGTYYLRAETTVLELLGQAGGVGASGVEQIRVTRGAMGDAVTVLDYGDLIATGAGNVVLVGGDVVYVPESMVTVMGQVQTPGDVPLRDGLTVATAVAAAGGALETANLGRVFVLRGEERLRVSLRRVQKGKAADVELEPGDRVFVGLSVL